MSADRGKSKIRIGRLAMDSAETDSGEAKRLARRVAELLGEGLAGGMEVRPRREAIVNVAPPTGLKGEKLAAFVAREIQRMLG